MSRAPELSHYVIRGGEEGRARLATISRVLAPATRALLDRFEPLAGAFAIDAGCGGGDVSFELASRVGPTGRVLGFDLDEEKLAAAREEAQRRGLGNVEFVRGDVLDTWPAAGASLVYVRFVLCHMRHAEDVLARAMAAMESGALLIAEDIDYDGAFCHPPSPAYERYRELYVAAAQRRGGDPFIGRRLVPLLESMGLTTVDTALAQPFGRTGDVKQVASLTLSAVADAITASGLATADEVAAIGTELARYAARPDTIMSFPRIFQAWGRKGQNS